MARSDIDRLIHFLQEHGGKATLSVVKETFSWSDEKIDRLVDESDDRLKWARGGRSRGIAQVAIERGARGKVHLYSDICRVLESTWAKKCGMQAALALDTSLNGRARTGSWSRPDCVLVWYPARRSRLDESATLSTYEIKAPGRFDIRSVYEAHAQGFGADFSWVLFHRPAVLPPGGPHPDWRRIRWAASVCDVGLISYVNAGNASTWQVEARAVRRRDSNRAEFVKRAVPASMRVKTEMSLEEMRR
jgi:hypothetical protein